MILLDSDVAIDIPGRHQPALDWLNTLAAGPIGLPGLVVMELIQGCRDRLEQSKVERFCSPFTIHWPSPLDCSRAMTDFAAHRLARNLGLLDALIAHTAVGLGEPLATFNLKHYRSIVALRILQPY